jgi:hypothetical protein
MFALLLRRVSIDDLRLTCVSVNVGAKVMRPQQTRKAMYSSSPAAGNGSIPKLSSGLIDSKPLEFTGSFLSPQMVLQLQARLC